MRKPDSLSSTEKLLDVIRKKRADVSSETQLHKPSRKKPERASRVEVPRLVRSHKTQPTIGIDIGHNYLRLVRATRKPGETWEIEDLCKREIPPQLSKQDPEFGSFVRTALDSVGASSRGVSLWAIMTAARVEIQTFTIPRLPKRQVANAVFWMLKKKTSFDEKVTVFDFELREEVLEQGTTRQFVMVYTAPRPIVEELQSFFAGIGRPLTGISIAPFALQNIFRTGRIAAEEKTIASLYIGNDFSRIDIYSHENLIMSRGIKTGQNSMIDTVSDEYRRLWPQDPALTFKQAHKLLFSVCQNAPPLLETDAGYGIGEQAILDMIRPVLERIASQTEMTFKFFSTERGQEKVTDLFISGDISLYQPVLDYISAQLEIPCSILNPVSSVDTRSICANMNEMHCLAERTQFAPALGAAISDNAYSPNFLFTFRDKDKAEDLKRVNKGILAAFIAVALVLGGILVYQQHILSQKRSIVAKMETTLASIGQNVNREHMLKMSETLRERQSLAREYARRYLGMALISELAALTPPNIRIVDLKMTLPQGAPMPTAAPANEGAPAIKAPAEATLFVEGLIFGDRQLFETSLAGYRMALEASPLFSHVAITKSNTEPYPKDGVFHFFLNFTVEG
jgi:Tfp pilus assembly PilM family ATPase